VPAELFTAVARERPLRAVFYNSTFASDTLRNYSEEAFRRLSPGTDIKVI
jgi:adenine-specific DNA-methyltransferase